MIFRRGVITFSGGVIQDFSSPTSARAVVPEPTTIADMDIYVDTSTGNDTTGNGRVSAPYATITKAYEAIPNTIKHRVRLLITAGTYTNDFPELIDNKFEGNGSLAFIGVGVPSVVEAGPYTLTGSIDVGVTAGLKLSASAASWTTDAYYGKFIRMLSGTRANDAYPVLANDADDVWSTYYSSKPTTTDTFDIVKPAVTATASQITFSLADQSEMWTSSWGNARVAVINMNLDFSSSSRGAGLLAFYGPGSIWLDFVRVIVPDTTWAPVMLYDGPSLNYYLPLDTGLQAASGSSIEQIGDLSCVGFTIERASGPTNSVTDLAIYSGSALINNMTCRDSLEVYYTGSVFTRCALGRLLPFVSGMTATNVLLYGKTGSVGFSSSAGTLAILSNIHVLTGTSAFRTNNAQISLNNCTCESTLTGYGLEAYVLSNVSVSGSVANLTGVSGDIIFKAPVPEIVASWPTADGDGVTDGLGAFIIRSDG
jgi:hypothetical protein